MIGRLAASAWVALGVSGCVVAIPPPVDPGALPACSAGAYGVLGAEPCERDEDCHACDLGAGCVARRAETACDAGTCAVACCSRRCTVVADGVEL